MSVESNRVVSSVAPEEETSIGILDYLDILIRYKKFIVRTTIIVAILAIIISLLMPKKYSSTALILPPQQDNSLVGLMVGAAGGGLGSIAGDLLGKGSLVDLYVTVLGSDRISDSIIDRFNLMKLYGIDSRIEMYKKLDQIVTIAAGKKDGIISITVLTKDPKRSADIANAYVEELGRLSAELSMDGGSKNRKFLEKRLAKNREDLARAEEAIKSFQSKNKTIDVTEQAKASIVGIAELRAQLAVQEIQLASLLRRFTENSQEVKDAKAAISKIKSSLVKLEGSGKGGAIPNVGTIPEMGQEYVRLMRDFKVQEVMFELLTKQYEIANLTEQKDVPNLQVLQYARPADKKISPKRGTIIIIATFLGFIGSVLASFVLEFSRRIPAEELTRLQEMKRELISWRSSSKTHS